MPVLHGERSNLVNISPAPTIGIRKQTRWIFGTELALKTSE
jgi:hypothetical protein